MSLCFSITSIFYFLIKENGYSYIEYISYLCVYVRDYLQFYVRYR